MIHKSYKIEENIDILKYQIALIYGENKGLIIDLKKKLKKKHHGDLIIKFYQEDLINNHNLLLDEIQNYSLFGDKKIFFIDNVDDKILNIIEKIYPITKNNIIYLFSGLLEKRSKLRIFFEDKNDADVIPCYEDNENTLKKIIQKKLIRFEGLNTSIINIILESCGKDRSKINNELEKIKSYFNNKTLNEIELSKLINLRQDENFNYIKDMAICGNKLITNRLLNSTVLEVDKIVYYLALITLRLTKLKELVENKSNIETIINKLRPPIFWKDKPIFVSQAKIWSSKKINEALNKSYEIEILIKSKTNTNKKTIFKKHIVDICNLANAA